MARIPDPQPGLVIRHAYLWQRDATQGRVEGTKYRPAVVVLARQRKLAQVRRVP